MKEVIDFYTKNPVGCLATVENGKPRVRPFQFLFADSGKLYFCTANTKDVYRQLKANPAIEFVSTSPEYVFMRVCGEAKFSKDMALKKRVLDTFDMIRGIYQTPENPVFEIFFIEHGSVKIADLSGKPARFVKF
jgi:uncharacterized pyridoxamine 5'-phosphate oxidase family protein